MTTLNASETRIPPQLYSQVVYSNEQVCVEHRSLPSVYLVSEADMKILDDAKQRSFEESAEKMTKKFDSVLKKLAN
jgi:hypothetical protein